MSHIRLVFDNYEAGILPSAGGALTFLRYGGIDLLRPTPSLEALERNPLLAACFPCVPYFGRLYDGLSFNDRHWRQSPTLPLADETHALHGEGWVSDWRVISQTTNALVCGFDHVSMEAGRYPFSYAARQKFSLGENGLTITLGLQNTGAETMPCGLGIHPYFHRRTDTVVSFTAGQFWSPPARDDRGAFSLLPDNLGVGRFAPLPSRTRDHSYADFGGVVTVRNDATCVTMTTQESILHLYAPEGEPYFCLEPVSHLPGMLASNSPGGGWKLAPDQRMDIQARFEFASEV